MNSLSPTKFSIPIEQLKSKSKSMKKDQFRQTESDCDQNLVSSIINDDHESRSIYVKDENSSNGNRDDQSSDDEQVSESICFH